MSTKVNNCVRTARLSMRERRFLFAVIGGATAAASYLALATKPMDLEHARAPASRMFARIKGKLDWAALLEDAGLGELRILRELEAALNATKRIFFNGQQIAEVPDNAARIDALVLLADLLGRRKTQLDLHIDTVTVIPPPKPEGVPLDEE
jgi:hypothetical protein